jgi:hypothetical protein
VSDVTKKFGESFHEFKTQLYTELLNDVLPALDAQGLEYKKAVLQKILSPGM